MTSTLRNLILAPAAAVAFALASHSAMADATAKVPFNFTVEGKICPAGEYTIHRNLANNTVILEGRDNKVGFMWNLQSGESAAAAKSVVLQFTEKGESHALRLVQYGPASTGRLDKKDGNQREHETLRIVAGQ